MNFLRSRRGLVVLGALLLILFVVRPGVYPLRNRISNTISAALGRRVSIDNVRFHVLPRPGFDLEGLVIYDDPAFSAEPMIRAPDVSAPIRFRSLLYGRLEIATLSANEPSINLVRNDSGRWNLAALIERNAQIPAAPTQKRSSERRRAFPYLEASNARVNFKIRQEKTPYAFVDADLALWQDSENSWGARIKARPMRADSNLTDTGEIQINVAWQRATSLRQTPMHLVTAWQKGQLGQITKFFSGADRGWRGDVDLSATFDGTPEALAIQSRLTIDGFRRYDIVDSRNLRVATHCAARYSVSTASLDDVLCESPVGEGALRLTGNASSITGAVNYDLRVVAQELPISSIVTLAHEAKQHLPGDLSGEGVLNAEFHLKRSAGSSAEWSGNGAASEVKLRSNNAGDSIVLDNVPLTLVGNAICCTSAPLRSPFSARTKTISKPVDVDPDGAYLRLGPGSLVVNASAPVSVGGWLSRSGYRFFLRGDLDLKNLFRVEDELGVPAVRPASEGMASLDVSISGPWQGLTPPNSLGTIQLRNVRAEMHAFNAPLEIPSAMLVLTPNLATLQMVSARVGDSHWSGSVRAPRHCAPNCLYQFDLTTDKLSTTDVVEWLAPHPTKRPWYRLLGLRQQGPSPLLALRAHGNLHVGQFAMKKVVATQLATELTADNGKITLSNLRTQLLQGVHQGAWNIDASAQPPQIRGSGSLQDISLDQLGGLMSDGWISGTADGTFDVTVAGATISEMLMNSDGTLQFSMRRGSLTHVAIPGAPAPLSVHRFSGNLRVKEGIWQLTGGHLESRDGLYQVSGTSSPSGVLDFIFTRGDEQSWNLTGTIAKPRATPTSRTEAEARSAQP